MGAPALLMAANAILKATAQGVDESSAKGEVETAVEEWR